MGKERQRLHDRTKHVVHFRERTNRGRVVYERKKHFADPGMAYRVALKLMLYITTEGFQYNASGEGKVWLAADHLNEILKFWSIRDFHADPVDVLFWGPEDTMLKWYTEFKDSYKAISSLLSSVPIFGEVLNILDKLVDVFFYLFELSLPAGLLDEYRRKTQKQ